MTDDGPPDQPRMGTFILRLRLGLHGPPSGSIGLAGESTSLTFHGWIGLMAAVKRLRGDFDVASHDGADRTSRLRRP